MIYTLCRSGKAKQIRFSRRSDVQEVMVPTRENKPELLLLLSKHLDTSNRNGKALHERKECVRTCVLFPLACYFSDLGLLPSLQLCHARRKGHDKMGNERSFPSQHSHLPSYHLPRHPPLHISAINPDQEHDQQLEGNDTPDGQQGRHQEGTHSLLCPARTAPLQTSQFLHCSPEREIDNE